MGRKKYKQYSMEFKKDALRLLETSGKSVAEIERDLGLSSGLLYKWRDKYQVVEKGAGLIEKAADLVINRRCELRGMTWYRFSADAISNLRAIRLNGQERWHQFWEA